MTRLRQHEFRLLFRLLALAIALAPASLQASNQLSGHPSPYLALHANDPVDWQSWQAQVFERSRAEDKLVLVSIGYFSCHWCHVMQRESYQHAQTAEYLNRHYVSVKVDRELDPDLDQRLIEFVEQTRGVAGWPLNVFLTPEGYPLTGFTYLPQPEFLRVLQQLQVEWRRNRPALSASAREFFESGLRHDESEILQGAKMSADELAQAFVDQAMRVADDLQGGFGNTSKFPNAPRINALLDAIRLAPEPDPEVVEFVHLSLHAMALRNLQDHVNGGFFRYTTDPDWQTPHYEKMLYDNALLAQIYLKAHQLWPERGYADIALRTLDFIETGLRHENGGYMSSLSAVDASDREGGAYLWTSELLAATLDSDELGQLEQDWLLQSQSGEFLLRPLDDERAANTAIDQPVRKKLQAQRARMPADDKRLASWNAMTLAALTGAAEHDARFGERAQALFEFMRMEFFHEQDLIRFAGNAGVADAVFEDYAYTAMAFRYYGQRFTNEEAIEIARGLNEQAYHRFLVDGRWQEKASPLIPMARGKWIIEDLVFYSPMTLWLETTLTLPGIDPEIRSEAVNMLLRSTRELHLNPYHYGSFIMLRVENPA